MIKEFYLEIWTAGMPPYEHLTEQEKYDLQKTIAFSAWRLGRAWSIFVNDIKKAYI